MANISTLTPILRATKIYIQKSFIASLLGHSGGFSSCLPEGVEEKKDDVFQLVRLGCRHMG